MKKFKKVKNNKEKSEKKLWKTILSFILVIAIVFISFFLVFILYIVITSPDFEQKELFQSEPTILYDRNGKELARVGSEDSTIVSYEDIPEVLIDALVATEDARFFEHNGLDLFRFVMATGKTLLGSDFAGGASTLSMQVIKNTYTQKGKLESKKLESLVRKFRDIYMAVFKLEANYTKEEIIEFYLNSQWFANSKNINTSGMYGIERASQYYFGKSVKDISLAEASLMAGMFQNPRLYNPYRNPEGCRNRQKTVLKLLVRHGYITEEQQNAVLAIPVESLLTTQNNTGSALTVESYQAFVDYVINEVNEDLELNPRKESLKIYTTYDPDVQKVLEKVEKGEIYDFNDELIQEAIAVTNTVDGSVVAISGGRNYAAQGTNRAVGINRQPGSTAKPIMEYAMYIQHVSQSSYAMFLDDEYTYSNGTSISNYDNKYRGLITMRYALEDSRNIPALKAFQAVYKIDPKIISDFVHSVGINYGDNLYESASIGGFNGVSPLELSAAYAAFGRGGYYIKPYGYTKVINTADGKEYNNSYSKTQVMDESTAFMINNILEGAYKGSKPASAAVAGKTGTTNLDKTTKSRFNLPNSSISDSWFVTYSPSYSVALWLGYDSLADESKAAEQKKYLNSTNGGKARRTIMNHLASKIHKKDSNFKSTKTVTKVNVEKESFPAQLCSPFTPEKLCISEYFVRGTEPTEVSQRFSQLENPTNGTYEYNGSSITLKWNAITTPNAINSSYLVDHFNKYYDNKANDYYKKRLEYNSQNIGSLNYEVYLRTTSGDTKLGSTSGTSFVYTPSTGGEYTFIIKSAYTIFTSNKSSGLIINAKTVDSNVNDLITNNDSNIQNSEN